MANPNIKAKQNVIKIYNGIQFIVDLELRIDDTSDCILTFDLPKKIGVFFSAYNSNSHGIVIKNGTYPYWVKFNASEKLTIKSINGSVSFTMYVTIMDSKQQATTINVFVTLV